MKVLNCVLDKFAFITIYANLFSDQRYKPKLVQNEKRKNDFLIVLGEKVDLYFQLFILSNKQIS